MKARKMAGCAGFVACLCLSGLILPAVAEAVPRIFYTDINSGPNSGGENNNGAYLSLFGKGFGTDLTQVKVYVGNGEVTRYMYLGASHGRPDVQQLSVQLGPNTSTGAIKVVVNGVSSNTDKTFIVRSGNFYYISETGNDSTGVANNINKPFRTPNFVKDISVFGPGDFIIVRGGQYDLGDGTNNIGSNSWLRANTSGTAAAPMAFLGYPSEKVEVLHSNTILIFSNYVSIAHWVVGNFLITLTDCVSPGEFFNIGPTVSPQVCADTNGALSGTATDIKLVNTEANGNNTGGFCSGADGLVEIQHSQNVKIIGISLHNTSLAKGDNESAHAIYLSANQKGTEVGWNALYNIPATRGVIQVHQDSFAGACWGTKQLTNITIHDNLLHDLAGQSILLDGGAGDIEVYNNVIYHQVDHRYPDVIALRSSGGKLNAKLYNNTVYVNPNQTSQGWILGIGSYMGSYCPESLRLYNNIFVVTEAQDLYYHIDPAKSCATSITSDNNIWYGSKNHKPAFAGPHELYVNPKFADPGKGYLWLRRNSPAIGKGSPKVSPIISHDYNLNPRIIENGYDIGAYQHQAVVD